MRKIFTFCLLVLACATAFASHIVGGEMFYVYIGPGSAAGTNKYRITLRLFRDELCPPPCAEMPERVWIGIFDNGTGRQYPGPTSLYFEVKGSAPAPVGIGDNPQCVVNPPKLNYNVAEYTFTVDLPANAKGYTATYQTCCRVNPMTNVFNTGAVGSGTGSTYSCSIPGTDALGAGGTNNSPVFSTSVSPICQGKPFTMDFSVKDPDGDAVIYSFCEAFNGGSATSASNINPAPPPYRSVPYINGFSAATPLGNAASIDPKTGIISGIAPAVGRYVVCVCASEYRNGKLISIHRKDFIVNVANCDYAGAQLYPSYTFCKTLTASFQNLNNSTLNESFFWDFGDGSTSTETAPSHTYADTGTYTIKLEVNKGQPCAASTTAKVRVYPFFNADFSFAGGCVNKPTSFTDRTTTTYGTVASWEWNFGSGTSTMQNPQFTFNATGPKYVQLIATSTKGCQDTIVKTVDITDKPFIDLRFRDTLICKGDRLQLEALGLGNFSWTPATAITNANTAKPTVSPDITTSYVVKLDQEGCINFDTVKVRVTDQVIIQGRPDTTICATDSLQLGALTNGLQFRWSPAIGISNPDILYPKAAPKTTTTYTLRATVGGCNNTDDIKITVVPYPLVDAGKDTLICYNTEAQLMGSTNAEQFNWSPAAQLSDASLSPRVRLTATQAFVLSGTSSLGCPKPTRDTVVVNVLPPVNAFAGRDTAVIIGQPLQLQASGGVDYHWYPPFGLSDPKIANPVAVYDGAADSIRYTVVVTNEAGCIDSAAVVVRVFKTEPRIFVPTAFTPNGDGNNDIFRPIPVGMSRIEYFQVYNRWGELVFQSTDGRSGWDGRINGSLQGTGTFVWLVKGVDFTGKIFSAKGTVTLIR